MQLPEKKVDKLRPFVPPVAVKLCVVRRYDERRMAVECLAQQSRLLDAFADEMHGVLGGLFARHSRNIRLLVLLRHVAPRYAVIFEAEVAAFAVGVQVWFEIVERRVPANVTVKFTVKIVTRITDLSGPDLLARFDISCKYGSSVWTQHRCVDAVTRSWVAVEYCVRVRDEIFDARVF